MCKTRIEKAVKISEVKFAKWDKKSKMLNVAFESTITADSLQKRIAAVGHDTEQFKADKEVYKNLPGCCLYRDKPTTH
jgi:Cu(I)/Ag(I) efflux system membrane fusion protein